MYMKRYRDLTEEEKDKIVEEYLGGKTWKKLQEEFNISKYTLQLVLRARGARKVEVKGKLTHEEEMLIAKLHREGKTRQEIADILGRSVYSIYKRIPGGRGRSIEKQPLGNLGINPPPFEFKEGEVITLLGYDEDIQVKLRYLGKTGNNHVFQSVRGKWKVCYTDKQLLDLRFTREGKK